MLWIKVWHWWFELVAAGIVLLATLVLFLGRPTLDMTALLTGLAVVVVLSGLLASSYRKYQKQVRK